MVLEKTLESPSDRKEIKPLNSFLKNLFIYFNWRLITLQYCGGFCHTLTSISYRCTCVPPSWTPLPPPSPLHPSGWSQCTSFGYLSYTREKISTVKYDYRKKRVNSRVLKVQNGISLVYCYWLLDSLSSWSYM